MKNKSILAALLLSSSCAFAAPAAYIGVNAGSTDQEATARGESLSETSTGVKVYGGFQIIPALGIEAGYVRFGKASYSEDDVTFSTEPTSIYAAVTGTLPISASFKVFGKLGVTRNKTDVGLAFDGARFTDKKSVSSGVFGVGAQYKFSETLSVVAEYENYGKVAKYDEAGLSMKASLISVGLRLAF